MPESESESGFRNLNTVHESFEGFRRFKRFMNLSKDSEIQDFLGFRFRDSDQNSEIQDSGFKDSEIQIQKCRFRFKDSDSDSEIQMFRFSDVSNVNTRSHARL